MDGIVPVKSKMEILQTFVAFSEYMNFTTKIVILQNYTILHDYSIG